MSDSITATKSTEEIFKLIEAKELKLALENILVWVDPEIADLLVCLKKDERILVFRALPRQRAADVFSYLEPQDQDSLLTELTDTDTRTLLANLNPDDRTTLLQELPATVTRRLLQLLSPEDLIEARQLLGYPEESVGRLMTPDYIRIRAEWTVEQSLSHVRKFGRDSEIFNILYVTDKSGKLIDKVRMRRLILSSPSQMIKELLNYNCISISAFDDRENAVEMIKKYDLNALPVVDSEGVLLGIVTVDDILDVAEEEATEDIQLGVAVNPLESSYSSTLPFELFQKRIGWLLILILINLISAAVISNYEEQLLKYITLALFMPLVIASGGNSGAQSATLMVRAIATGDLKSSDWIGALTKEVLVGVLMGLAMGGLAFLVGWLYGGDTSIAKVIGLSIVLIVLVANFFGALLPFALERINIDPAVSSSPLITSIMDVLGLIIYFSIAVVLL